MPTPAGPELRKVTLNLYEEDCIILENHYGRGWTSIVRDIAHNHASLINRGCPKPKLGDIQEDPALRIDNHEY